MTKKNKDKPSAVQRRLTAVRQEFDGEALKRICVQDDFSNYAPRIDLPAATTTWGGYRSGERFYHYRDNGASILAVAHLDHVQWDGTCEIVETGDGPLALSGALDDRLGAYVILELLPRLGIKVDWLLTTDEEMGASTASEFFVEHKQYNWMIEFDRGGTDVVMYQYDTDDNRKLVEDCGARVGLGSYSDIADLDHLGCAGFNWGVGYYDYHSKRSHAWLEDTFKMVARFVKFYHANVDTHLSFDVDTRVRDCPACHTSLDKWGFCWKCEYDDIVRVNATLNEPDDDAVAFIARQLGDDGEYDDGEEGARAAEG